MIIVTGTKRSGTSLWMQVLIAAGFEHVGGAFPGVWQESIGEANPEGFYESMFRHGIYYRTNPHPKTGQFLFPSKSTQLLVKVFIPGLVRSDYAFLNRVVATLRPWREYCVSISALLAQEKAFFEERRARRGAEASADPAPEGETRPPALVWWAENYALLRDMATRRYPYFLCSHGKLLADPASVIEPALRFLGSGSLERAVEVVRPSLHRSRDVQWTTDGLDPLDVEFFDELYETIHRREPLSAAMLKAANETNQRIVARTAPPTPKARRVS